MNPRVYLDFEAWWAEHKTSFRRQYRESQILMISNEGIKMKEEASQGMLSWAQLEQLGEAAQSSDIAFFQGQSSPPIAENYEDKDLWTILSNAITMPKSNECKSF